MDKREAQRIYTTLNADLIEVQKREAALRKLVEGLRELYPGLDARRPTARPQNGSGRKPTRQEGIKRVLHEKPWLTVQELTDELVSRRWGPKSKDPQDAVRTVTNRMYREAKALVRRKNDDGVFTYALPEALNESQMSEAPEGASESHNEGSPDGPAS